MMLISFGTRPEKIKVKPIIDKMYEHSRVLFTGQHEDLDDSEYDYVVRISNQDNRLDSIISSVMGKLTLILQNEPGITHVLVQGDTTSALAVAISAFNHGLKIIHLEAGLRTNDLSNPYPEEGNRRMISQIANIHLCPTELNERSLQDVSGNKFVVGNTAIDSLIPYRNKCKYNPMVLVTMHRRENLAKMDKWFTEINRLAEEYWNLEFILPLLGNVKVIDPLSHDALLNILVKARIVITDSGGLQEECSYFNKKCLVCRMVTERVESLNKSSFLVPIPELLRSTFDEHIKNYKIDYACPYGDGSSTDKIYEILMNELNDYSADS